MNVVLCFGTKQGIASAKAFKTNKPTKQTNWKDQANVHQLKLIKMLAMVIAMADENTIRNRNVEELFCKARNAFVFTSNANIKHQNKRA